MVRTLAVVTLLGTALAVPAVAQSAETEFGADLAVRYVKQSGGGSGTLELQTPVDLRVAFHGRGRFAVEPRLAALFLTSGGDNTYTIDPGLNLLAGLGGSTHRSGPYVTAGGDVRFAGGTGLTGRAVYSLNAGFGLRAPLGKVSSRAEFSFGYTPRQGTRVLSGIVSLGMRLGLSFFD